jgi:hypothetical protein
MKRRGTVRVGLVVLGLVTAVGAVWLLRSGGVGPEDRSPNLSAERKDTKESAVAAAKAPSRVAAVETAAHEAPAPDTSDRTDPTDQAKRTPAADRPHVVDVAQRHAQRRPLPPRGQAMPWPARLELVAPARIPACGRHWR